ncbi:MAG: FAD-dependent oxidoreductase [bacterium]|nr:FAD-dependent oxidoreductase [bacterium]
MRSHVRVAVIGGGVVGCSVLYHLTKFGWTDVVLIERSELTSGSTWHAAGGFHTLNADPNIAALQGYTIRLYRELEEITGLSCGLHHVGGLTIAETPDRMDFLKAERARHRHMGLETEIVGPDEIAEYTPIINTDGLLGALWDPLDGHLDPSGTTHAYARAARMAGAEISLHNRVLELHRKGDGQWEVVTEKGTVVAEHVVNAAGLWAREVGLMAGVRLPLHPLEHQYLVTGDIAEVYGHGKELPHVMDPAGESYLRQEGRGLVIGIYEQACRHWAVDGTSWDFGHELLADDVDRIAGPLETAYRRYPVLQSAGIKRIINGPFTFAPDGNPLVGRVPGVPGYWACCAVMAGFSQAGGVGLALAEWMIEGEPSRDIFAMDVARFGDWTTPAWTRAKTRENYQRRFAIAYPNEELPAGRPFHTTPAHAAWKERRAVFGSAFGMEHVNYFAPPGEPLYETPSFRRSNAFAATARECRGVREGVGINEIHNFSKFRIEGEGAAAWLDRIMAGRLPKEGRLTLSPLLNHRGRLAGDFTIARDGPESFRVQASYVAQDAHMRLFLDLLPAHGVTVANISRDLVGFQIAGPRARDLLKRTTDADVSGNAMPFRAVRRITIGNIEATVQRVSYTGDLGYEIYVPPAFQRALFETLQGEGAGLGLVPFGMRAMMSLRLEKSFGSWLREYRPDYTAAETGLDRFIAFDKLAFPGRDAALKEAAEGPGRRLVTFVVDAADADCVADEPVWWDGRVVGFVTSGGYAHHVEKSVALGFVPADMAEAGGEFLIEILGDMRRATIVDAPLFDPSGSRLRM